MITTISPFYMHKSQGRINVRAKVTKALGSKNQDLMLIIIPNDEVIDEIKIKAAIDSLKRFKEAEELII